MEGQMGEGTIIMELRIQKGVYETRTIYYS